MTLVTDAGEVRSFDLGPSTSVRIADPELAAEVNRYLNLIGSAKAVDLRRLTISAAGTGEREIFVSYISEVPVWKSTYRILLDSKHEGKPLVQGWAVVDNTIGEDWKDVQLSLVAGAPQSFVQNISQPMYVRRPEVALPESAMLTPQTHESAMNATPALHRHHRYKVSLPEVLGMLSCTSRGQGLQCLNQRAASARGREAPLSRET